MMSKIAVIGNGSWATAILKTLESNKKLNWWVRNEEIKNQVIKIGRNPNYLRSADISISHKNIFTDIKEIVNKSDIIFFIIPSIYIHNSINKLTENDLKNKIVVSAIKGIVPETNNILSEYFSEKYKVQKDKYVFLTGPTHAEEVHKKRLSYFTLASASKESAQKIGNLFDYPFIQTRYSSEVVSLEYASILKNIYAIASGICYGIGYGDNFQAVLISNAIREMKTFLCTRHNCENIVNSGYLGDLLVTSFSQLSRNRTFGRMIGRGYSAKSALIEMNMIPEGYYAVNSFNKIISKSSDNLPIIKTVYNILYENKSPVKEIKKIESYLY